MKQIFKMLLWMGACWIGLAYATPVYAFLGEYNSATGNDMAFIAMFKSTDVDYEDSYDSEFDVERKALILGASKAVMNNIKVFGTFNWALDGKIEDSGFDLDHGYALSTGGSYTFLDHGTYSVSGYAQLDYIIEEQHENSQANADITLDGFEILTGVMGKYNVNENFSVFGAMQFMLISDLTADVDAPASSGFNDREYDVERDDTFGFKIGGIYDQPIWFLKFEFCLGMDNGYAFSGGMKF